MKIEIRKGVAERLAQRVEEEGRFQDVDEYVNDLLKQVVERLDAEESVDESKVKERLRSLGYFD